MEVTLPIFLIILGVYVIFAYPKHSTKIKINNYDDKYNLNKIKEPVKNNKTYEVKDVIEPVQNNDSNKLNKNIEPLQNDDSYDLNKIIEPVQNENQSTAKENDTFTPTFEPINSNISPTKTLNTMNKTTLWIIKGFVIFVTLAFMGVAKKIGIPIIIANIIGFAVIFGVWKYNSNDTTK